jgi:lactoylglutathione lyase
LGCVHAFSLQDQDGNPWIEYVKVADGQFIEFFYRKEEPQGGSHFLHLCLRVDDVFEKARALEAAGATLRIEPRRGKDGNWQCWVDDPDGIAIELMQIDPSSPQAKA